MAQQAALAGFEDFVPTDVGDELDYWETPRSAIEPIVPILRERLRGRPAHHLLDPGCGRGNILVELAGALELLSVHGVELHPERALQARSRVQPFGCIHEQDFLSPSFRGSWTIVCEAPTLIGGNPPYTQPRETIGLEFIEHSIACAEPQGGIVALLLPLDFATGVDRTKRVHSKHTGALYPLRSRPSFGGDGSGQRPVAWFVWDLAEPYSEYRVIG
jgi:hypothetical protein